MPNTSDFSRRALPGQDNYEQALKIALKIFGRKDPGRVAQRAGACLDGRSVVIPHLGREIVLGVDTHRLTIRPFDHEAPTWLAILTLHYLNNADGRIPTGRLKHFREFKDGLFYEPAFNRRTRDILVQVFGADPAGIVRGGEKLGGKASEIGDSAVELRFFPHLPLTCILWQGDKEFPPEAVVLFDETADVFFSAEDMAVAGQMAILELLKAARSCIL